MKMNQLILAVLLIFVITGLGCTKKTGSGIDQIMNADKNFTFPKGFTPDPGEAGKKTIEGITSDHDDLRDDLKRWIYVRFPNDSKKRAALKQMAISYQKTLFLQHDKDAMKDVLKRHSKALACLYGTFPTKEAHLEGGYVKAKMLNTKERIQRHLEVNNWFDGMSLGRQYPDDGTACEQ